MTLKWWVFLKFFGNSSNFCMKRIASSACVGGHCWMEWFLIVGRVFFLPLTWNLLQYYKTIYFQKIYFSILLSRRMKLFHCIYFHIMILTIFLYYDLMLVKFNTLIQILQYAHKFQFIIFLMDSNNTWFLLYNNSKLSVLKYIWYCCRI